MSHLLLILHQNCSAKSRSPRSVKADAMELSTAAVSHLIFWKSLTRMRKGCVRAKGLTNSNSLQRSKWGASPTSPLFQRTYCTEIGRELHLPLFHSCFQIHNILQASLLNLIERKTIFSTRKNIHIYTHTKSTV